MGSDLVLHWRPAETSFWVSAGQGPACVIPVKSIMSFIKKKNLFICLLMSTAKALLLTDL